MLFVVGYLLGSVPFGVIAGRIAKGVDVRERGSGNTGMTNVLRTVGVRAAAVVLVLDMSKSVTAILVARVFTDSQGAEVAGALASIAGHSWPVFAGFKGGKGVSLGWSGLVVLSPVSGLAATVIGMPFLAVTRFVSLGSIIGTASGSAVLVALALSGHQPPAYLWYALIGGAVILVRHRDNFGRLLRGEERKLGQSEGKTASQGKADRGKGLRWPRSV